MLISFGSIPGISAFTIISFFVSEMSRKGKKSTKASAFLLGLSSIKVSQSRSNTRYHCRKNGGEGSGLPAIH